MSDEKIGLAVATAVCVGACLIREHVRSEYGIDPWENAYLLAIAVVSGIIAAWFVVRCD